MTTNVQPLNKLGLPHNNAPIGIFDSGVGGLSVWQHVYAKLPHEQYLYVADTHNVPYGTKTAQEIEQLTITAVSWLYQQGCKLVVIACNSASAHALVQLRLRYPNMPIVGLVPAVKPAVFASQSKKIAVLATQATLQGKLLKKVIEDIAIPQGVRVIKLFEPCLVPWVESGMPKKHIAVNQLMTLVTQLVHEHVDHLVLGCTHYPFFTPFLQQLSNNISYVDSGNAVAKQVVRVLHQHQLLTLPTQLANNTPSLNLSIKVTGDLQQTQTICHHLLPFSVNIEQIRLIPSS